MVLLLVFGFFSIFRRISNAYRRPFGVKHTAALSPGLLHTITFLLPLIAFIHTASASVSRPVPFGDQARKGIPDCFLYFSPENLSKVLLVEKASQRAYLYRSSNLSRPFRIYPCSTGENSGPKSERNDKRTPEGIYYATKSLQDQELASIYGVRAFPIDYPNPLDQRLGRMGYGIWLHGTNEALKQRDTKGCVVFRNKDILDLSRYIHEKQTPIIITEKIAIAEKERIQKEGAKLKSLVMNWLRAWRESRAERYMSFYGKDFVAQGKNWHQWRAYKEHLSKKYSTIDIQIDGLQILRENDVVLARFTQTYQADAFFSHGVKRLYLLKKSPEWKITYEFFKKKRELVGRPAMKLVREREVSSIERLITRWQEAWQGKDIRDYMAVYAKDFFSRGLDRDGWRRHKAELNRKNRRIQVEVRDLRIHLLSSARAVACFNQGYRSDTHHDYGRKTLQLVKRDKAWKIKNETWVPLKGRRTR